MKRLLSILLLPKEIEYQLAHTMETLIQRTRMTKKHLKSIEFQIYSMIFSYPWFYFARLNTKISHQEI